MNFLSWNVNGLGEKIKVGMVSRCVLKNKVDMLFIQESKITSISRGMIRALWKNQDYQWVGVNSTGASGGLLCVWDSKVFELKKKKINRNWIALWGEIVATKQEILMINVYGPQNRKEKRRVWEDLLPLIVEWSKSCL